MLGRRQPLQLRLLQHRRGLSLRLSWRLLPSRTRVREQPAGSPCRHLGPSWGMLQAAKSMVSPGMLHHHASALCHQYNLNEPQEPVSSHSHTSPQLVRARLFLTHHRILMLVCIYSSISLIQGLVQLLPL